MKRRRLVTDVEMFDLWLTKYHNISVDEVVKNYPESVLQTPGWYSLFPCTQEQHDEWNTTAKTLVQKVTGYSKKIVDHSWWSIYLNCSPKVLDGMNTVQWWFKLDPEVFTNAMRIKDTFVGHDRITAFGFLAPSAACPLTPIRGIVTAIDKEKQTITMKFIDPDRPWLRRIRFKVPLGMFGYQFYV